MSEAEITKEDWVEEYMFHLKEELEKKFDDPLKRTLVEMNHPIDTNCRTSSL